MKRLYQPMHRQAAAGPRQRPSDGGCVDRLNPSPRIGSKCDQPSSRFVAEGEVGANWIRANADRPIGRPPVASCARRRGPARPAEAGASAPNGGRLLPPRLSRLRPPDCATPRSPLRWRAARGPERQSDRHGVARAARSRSWEIVGKFTGNGRHYAESTESRD